jgi:hypothetical protein
MSSKTATAEDLAREEVETWESELPPEERSYLFLRGGLLACIVRWRSESIISGDHLRESRCTALLSALTRI